jgi:hypothetical protein
MKFAFAVLCFFITLHIFQGGTFNADYYAAFASEDTVKINAELSLLADLKTNQMKAYSGALQMKKAGLARSVSKLSLFAEGKSMLEIAIKKENENAEYRFLRLVIQENCPAILNYHNQINEDAEKVRNAFQSLSPELKKVIVDYSKKSKALKVGEF